jgi:hypothetical protein
MPRHYIMPFRHVAPREPVNGMCSMISRAPFGAGGTGDSMEPLLRRRCQIQEAGLGAQGLPYLPAAANRQVQGNRFMQGYDLVFPPKLKQRRTVVFFCSRDLSPASRFGNDARRGGGAACFPLSTLHHCVDPRRFP